MKQTNKQMNFLTKYRRQLRNELAEMGYGKATESESVGAPRPQSLEIGQAKNVTPAAAFVLASKAVVQ